MTRRAPEPVLLLGESGDAETEAQAYRAMRRLARMLIRREDAGPGPVLDPGTAPAHDRDAPGEPDAHGRRRHLRPL